jgi:predicted DNA-binding transcriptional regulator AlpA
MEAAALGAAPKIEAGVDQVDRLIDENEFSALTMISVSTVRKMRARGEGPLAVKVNRLVRYRLSSVKAWMESL